MFFMMHSRSKPFHILVCQFILISTAATFVASTVLQTNKVNLDNVLYVPKSTHGIQLKYEDPKTGNITYVYYTLQDNALEYYNTTLEEIESGILRGDPDKEDLTLYLPSGRTLEVGITQRTVINLVDEHGITDFSVDLEGFNHLTMEDIKDDPSLKPQPIYNLTWKAPPYRPVRSITVNVTHSALCVTVNRHNKLFSANTSVSDTTKLFFTENGIAVVVVQPFSSYVTYSNIHPTSHFGGFRDLIGVLRAVKPGRIVILATLYDGSLQLLEARRVLKEEFGSLISEDYFFRDAWAWVFYKGGQTIAEAFSPNFMLYEDGMDTNVTTTASEAAFKNRSSDKEAVSDAINRLSEYSKQQEEEFNELRSGDVNETALEERIKSRGGYAYLANLSHWIQDAIRDYRHNEFDHTAEDEREDYITNYNYNVHPIIRNKTSTPLLLDARPIVHEDPFHLVYEYYRCKDWTAVLDGDSAWKARVHFCQTNDGYSSLCQCKRPFTLREAPDKGVYEQDIPILIMAGSRTRLLFRLLETIGHQPGVHRDQILVVMDGWHEGVARLSHILGFKVLHHKVEGVNATTVSRNLRFALYHGLELYPKAQAFIVLEDDLVLSPDFYKFMQHTSHVFKLDQSIYCVSAFNHLSYPHTSKNASQLYRVDSFPAYGWMTSRDIVTHILPKWFPANVIHDWDFMVGMGLLRDKKECVVPDVNRALHGGIVGLHARATWFTERHYSRRTYNKDPNVELMNIESLLIEPYEARMAELIKSAVPLRPVDTFSLEIPNEGDVFVIYVDQPHMVNKTVKNKTYLDGGANEPVWGLLGEALGIWNTDVRELHDSTWWLHYMNKTLFVVGYPKSKFAKFKPADLSPIGVEKGANDFIRKEYSIIHHFRIPYIVHTLPPSMLWNKLFTNKKTS